MKSQEKLNTLYNFTKENYESLLSEWEKLPSKDKKSLPFTLFVISVFSTLTNKK